MSVFATRSGSVRAATTPAASPAASGGVRIAQRSVRIWLCTSVSVATTGLPEARYGSSLPGGLIPLTRGDTNTSAAARYVGITRCGCICSNRTLLATPSRSAWARNSAISAPDPPTSRNTTSGTFASTLGTDSSSRSSACRATKDPVYSTNLCRGPMPYRVRRLAASSADTLLEVSK